MSEFLKCVCPHCGQSIEYPAEGTGETVSCPTCEKSVTLTSENPPVNYVLNVIPPTPAPVSPSTQAETTTAPEKWVYTYTDGYTYTPAPITSPPASPRSEKPKKQVSLRFSRLSEETIKTKTQTGDTPVHRAAKTGRISEIPRHLLTAELFKIRNYRHQTPIEVAARYGQLDKVPKEFLTPELLSVAVSFYGTVLHHLAYLKMLDFIPDVYANSSMWNLRNSRGQTPRDVLEEVIEQERRQRERKSWVPPRLTLPIQTEPSKLLPAFSDESLRTIQIRATTSADVYTVNLLDYTCSNPLCKEIHSGVPPRDFGRLCKHIILALRQKNLVKQLPPIARGIAENGLPYDAYGIYPGRFAEDNYGRPIYITGPNYDGWVSVFALKRRNGVNYYRFGYNIKSKDSLQTMTSTGAAFYRACPAIDESVLH